MRDNVRSRVSPLTGLDPSNQEVAGMLAEIHMREFACTLQTLNKVNEIATQYHEYAFDSGKPQRAIMQISKIKYNKIT